MYLFNNLATTTVTSGGTTSSPSDDALVVSSAAAFVNEASSSSIPPTQFDILDPAVPSEIMTVTNQSGSGGVDWAVTRGAYGTTPVPHAADWEAEAVTTSAAMGVLVQSVDITGPPTAGAWAAGTVISDVTGMLWTCTTGGSPGTWTPLTKSPTAISDIQSVSGYAITDFVPTSGTPSMTVSPGEAVMVDASHYATPTVDTPAAAAGIIFWVTKTDSSSNLISVTPASGATVNGAPSFAIGGQLNRPEFSGDSFVWFSHAASG